MLVMGFVLVEDAVEKSGGRAGGVMRMIALLLEGLVLFSRKQRDMINCFAVVFWVICDQEPMSRML